MEYTNIECAVNNNYCFHRVDAQASIPLTVWMMRTASRIYKIKLRFRDRTVSRSRMAATARP